MLLLQFICCGHRDARYRISPVLFFFFSLHTFRHSAGLAIIDHWIAIVCCSDLGIIVSIVVLEARHFGLCYRDRVPHRSAVLWIAQTRQPIGFFARVFDCLKNERVDRLLGPLRNIFGVFEARRRIARIPRTVFAHSVPVEFKHESRKCCKVVRVWIN